MSSVVSVVAQIPTHAKNLYVVVNSNHGGFRTYDLKARVVAEASEVISFDGTILNCTNAGSVLDGIGNQVSVAIGDLYRDMGRKLHVQQNGRTCAIFTYSQLVNDNNAENEGVSPTAPNIWICTWQAAGAACPSAYAMVKAIRAA